MGFTGVQVVVHKTKRGQAIWRQKNTNDDCFRGGMQLASSPAMRRFHLRGALLRLAFLLAIALRVSAARADEPCPSCSPPPASLPAPLARSRAAGASAPGLESTTEWYGWQTLVTDGAAITFLAMATQARDTAPYLEASAATYLLGGPIVHAGHGNWGRAAGSLALRATLPFFGGLTGAALAQCRQGQWLCGVAETSLGTLLGISTAMALDWGVLAWEPATKPPPLVPVVRVGHNQTWAGVTGTF